MLSVTRMSSFDLRLTSRHTRLLRCDLHRPERYAESGELQWVSENERQLVRSTYLFFDYWDSAKQIGKPAFAYDIQYGSDQWGQLKLIRSVTQYLGPYSTITGALWPEANGRRSNWTCAR